MNKLFKISAGLRINPVLITIFITLCCMQSSFKVIADETLDPKWLVELIQKNTKDGLLQLPPDLAAKVPPQFSQYVNNPKQPRIPEFILRNTAFLTKIVTDAIRQNPPKLVPTTTTPIPTTTIPIPTTTPVPPTQPRVIMGTPMRQEVVTGPITTYKEDDVSIDPSQTSSSGGGHEIPAKSENDLKNYFGVNSNSTSISSNPDFGFSFFNSIGTENVNAPNKIQQERRKPPMKMPLNPYVLPPPIVFVLNDSKVPIMMHIPPYPFPVGPFPGPLPSNDISARVDEQSKSGVPFYPFPYQYQSMPQGPIAKNNAAPFQSPCFKLDNNRFIPC